MIRHYTALAFLLTSFFENKLNAQITFIAASTNTTTGTSIIITKPAGTTTNDVMVAHIAEDASGPTSITSPGWTQIRALNNTNYLYTVTLYKVATAGEPANYTFTYSGSSGWSISGGIITYRNVDSSTPIDIENGQNTPSASSHSTPSVTTTTANTMLVAFFGLDYPGQGTNSNWTPPAGMTERYDVNGTYEDIEAADVIQASAGATGVKTATLNAGSDKGTAQIVALRESAPMTYTSSTVTQSNTSLVSINSTDNEVIGIQIVTSGSSSPLSATSFSLNTTGTTAPATDITNAKLWYTGTSSSFATTTQFGSTVAAPNGSFTFTGTQTLSSGTNYFWLTYDVPAGATVNNVIDAECTSLTVTTPQTPTVTAPAGSRTISNISPPSFQCVATATVSGSSLTITTPACVALNDVMIAHVSAVCNSGGTYSAPAGWNRIRIIDNTAYLYSVSYYKVATASEPGNYTFTFSGSTVWDQAGGILVYRGVDPCSPIDVENGQTTPSSTSHSTPSVTTTASQDMIVALFAIDYLGSGPWTPPAGMTERDDINGPEEDLEAADVVQASPGATGVKTATSTTAHKGTAQIIALKANTSMTYSSSTTTQNNNSVVGINTTNNEVIGIQIVTLGCTSPLSATSFSLNTTGTTNAANDISNAKLWYTGTSSTFATTTQFGSTVAAPNGSFTITGTQALSSGINYFWLTYDVTAGATANNFIDGECTSLTVGTAKTPTVTAPANNRQISSIVPPTYSCVFANTCGCNSVTVTNSNPGCVVQDDLMIAHVTYRPNTGDVGSTPPAGWTRIFYQEHPNAQMVVDVFYKVAGASEPGTYTFTQTSNGSDMAVSIMNYRGVSTVDPIQGVAGRYTSGTTHTTPCLTASSDQAMIVTLFSLNNCNTCNLNDVIWTSPAGMTERYDIGVIQSSQIGGSGDDVVQVAKGCVQKTGTSSVNNNGFAIIISLRPIGGTDYYSTLYGGNNSKFNSGASVTLTKPGNVKQNDLLIVHLAQGYPTSSGATPPAGWTLIRYDGLNDGSTIGSWLYYKVAGASEPSTYDFSVSTGLNLVGVIMAYRGIDPASPIQASGGANTSGTSHSTPSINTTTDSAVVLNFYSILSSAYSYTPPANTTERYQYSYAQNHWKTVHGFDFIKATAGATGAQTLAIAVSVTGVSQIVALKRLSGNVLTGGCCSFAMQPLPITLLSFTGNCKAPSDSPKGGEVVLNWATASEINNDYFTIERAAPPNLPKGEELNWTVSGKVKGAGNSSTIRNYEFIDHSPSLWEGVGGWAYYRLKQTDYDGKFEYFPVIAVNYPCGYEADGFFIFPNPNNGQFTIHNGQQVTCDFEIYNVLGEKIYSNSLPIGEDWGGAIDLSNHPMGIYFYRFDSGKNLISSGKIIIQ
ncbi:MAG: T9SS type A sorting domain-containing protein [Bacteroidetes bacterium]|nr:T9SS type A sorting domain-containing protein [Bacteroidota bacterium]